MKKIFTLLVISILALTFSGFSQQNWGGTPPNCTLPAGFTLGQGAHMRTYNNPLRGCAEDCGIQTPGVGGNNPANVIFPAKSPNGSNTETVCFNFFVFDANMKCESDKDLQCSTFVTLYIVAASYDKASQAPSSSEYYGKSQQFLVREHGGENCLTVPFTKPFIASQKYRVFMDFGKGTACKQGNTKYVIDIIPGGGPMPVNLSSFLAGRTGNEVSLNWKTELEMTGNFEVQRSYDNSTFQTIATVAGSANNSSQSFNYIDKSNNSKTISFYRLKIVKQSGEISYSDIKTVKGIAGKAGFVIFPNPSVGNTRVTISDINEPTRVQVLDNSGRLVKSLILNNTNSVEITGLTRGSYMIRIIGSISGNTEIRKLSVIN